MGNLTVTPLATRKTTMQSRAMGEFVGLYHAKDTKTGQEGHLLFVYEWEKRDVVGERLLTDNPALLPECDESPSDWLDPNAADTGPEPDKHLAYGACQTTVYELV